MALYDVSTNEKKVSPSLVAGGTLYADVGIGTILPFGGTSDKIPQGYLLCDGTSLLRASYPELFAVIGTAFGSADSTHFNIPDMIGKTTMGVETGHALGTSEVGALPNIKSANQNATLSWASGAKTDPDSAIYSGGEGYAGGTNMGDSGAWNYIRMDASRSNSIYTDGQTKVDPANVRVNYIIKAKMVAMPSDFMSNVEEAVEEVAKGLLKSVNVTSLGVDSGGNVRLGYSYTDKIPVSFVPNNPGSEIIRYQFARYGDEIYITVNRTSGTVSGKFYYYEI